MSDLPVPEPPQQPGLGTSGRNRVFTDDKMAIFLQAIAAGDKLETACGLSHITERLAKHYITAGGKEREVWEIDLMHTPDDQPPPEMSYLAAFHVNYTFCKSVYWHNYRQRMKAIVDKNPMAWQAESTLNERLHPEEFGKRDKQDITQHTTIEGNIQVRTIPVREHSLDGEDFKQRRLLPASSFGDMSDGDIIDSYFKDQGKQVESERANSPASASAETD